MICMFRPSSRLPVFDMIDQITAYTSKHTLSEVTCCEMLSDISQMHILNIELREQYHRWTSLQMKLKSAVVKVVDCLCLGVIPASA